MDRPHLSALTIQELGEVFMTTLQQAGPDLLEADLEGIERQLQRLMRPVMGRVVETVMATIAATQATVQPVCATCGGRGRLVELTRVRQLQGLVGNYTLHRPYFVCAACHHGMAPVDEHLRLGRGALSPGLSRVAAVWVSKAPLGKGWTSWPKPWGWTSPRKECGASPRGWVRWRKGSSRP